MAYNNNLKNRNYKSVEMEIILDFFADINAEMGAPVIAKNENI